MKRNIVFLLFFILLSSMAVQAKKYPFKIDAPREVVMSRSATVGSKMVQVSAHGSSADKAIQQAMIDAVVSLAFFGVSGSGEMESCPAVLLEGRIAYDQNKIFFDKFFEQGTFMSYVKKVNSTYPTGKDNVKTKRGRRVQILLVVDWHGLAKYFKEAGLKTVISGLGDY